MQPLKACRHESSSACLMHSLLTSESADLGLSARCMRASFPGSWKLKTSLCTFLQPCTICRNLPTNLSRTLGSLTSKPDMFSTSPTLALAQVSDDPILNYHFMLFSQWKQQGFQISPSKSWTVTERKHPKSAFKSLGRHSKLCARRKAMIQSYSGERGSNLSIRPRGIRSKASGIGHSVQLFWSRPEAYALMALQRNVAGAGNPGELSPSRWCFVGPYTWTVRFRLSERSELQRSPSCSSSCMLVVFFTWRIGHGASSSSVFKTRRETPERSTGHIATQARHHKNLLHDLLMNYALFARGGFTASMIWGVLELPPYSTKWG